MRSNRQINDFLNKMAGSKIKLTIYSLIFFACFVFAAEPASAAYYNWGVLKSTNVLSGATVTAITGFRVTSSIPAGGSVSVQFSQDWVNFYNSSGTQWGWDSCSDGTTIIDLSGLGWSGGLLFYKLKLETTDAAATPSVTDIQVDYTGTAVPPDSGIRYPNEGTLISTNLLAGFGGAIIFFNGTEAFGYNITSLPAGTAVYAQFSRDGANFYNSSGTQWGWDTLSAGNHLEAGVALDLSGLHWSGESFYYKLKLTSIDLEQTPVISDIGLVRSAAQANSRQTNLLTDGLVGYWSFDGPDVSWGATDYAYDRSGQGNNGTITNMDTTSAVAGKVGQALSFDGKDDYVGFPTYNFGNQFTITIWAKYTQENTANTPYALIANKIAGASSNGFDIEVHTYGTKNGTVYFVTGNGASTNSAGTNTGTVSINTWYHYSVVVNRTSGTAKIYINGIDKTVDNTILTDFNTNSDWRFGSLESDSRFHFPGLIDEVRVYNRALSEDEIGQLYRAGARKMKIDPTKGYKTIIK